jgi:uncharacterized protein (TIGR04540 family)
VINIDEIIRNPKSIKAMAEEIKKLCDGYWSRKISEAEAKEIVIYWSRSQGGKLFKATELNSTITKIIGMKRIVLINKWLDGTQIKL